MAAAGSARAKRGGWSSRAACASTITMPSMRRGGGIKLTLGSDMVIKDRVRISRNWGTLGGGIYADQKTTINISGDVLLNDNAGGWYQGGAIYMNGLSSSSRPLSGLGPALLYLSERVVFSNNTAADDGGAISVSGQPPDMLSHIVVTGNVTFKENSATTGGAIRVEWSSTLRIEGRVRFLQNSASTIGGAILASQLSTVFLAGETLLEGNTALRLAGAIGLDNAQLIATGSVAVRQSSALYGGGIGAKSSSSISLADSVQIDSNCALSGGGVYAVQDSSLLSVGNVSITHNHAQNGGGIFVGGNTDVSILEGGLIAGNDAAALGGGIAASTGMLRINGTVVIANNTAGKQGGGISLSFGASMTMSGGASMNDNLAHGFPAAACLAPYGGESDDGQAAAGTYGGALCVNDLSQVSIGDAAVFTGNKASAGGGIAIRFPPSFPLEK